MPTTKTRTGSDGTTSLATRKGAARPLVRGSNGSSETAAAVGATDGAATDPNPSPSPTTLTTTVSGTITIGSDPDPTKNINVPISTTLPPTTPGTFKFSYKADSLDKATKINVGDFIKWAATQLGSATTVNDLPDSLKNLSVAVLNLYFDTGGDVDIAVEMGTQAGDKFDATWHPIPGLKSFTIADVTLEFKKGTVPAA